MSIKKKIKHAISFLLHGEQRPIYAQISYLTPNNRLFGKKIIVTGGSRGLGFSMAQKFVSEGADVLITGRDEMSLKRSAQQLHCKYLVLDAQDLDSFKSFYTTAEQLLGGLNCLVNNAGVSLHEQDFFHVTKESFDKQINTNLRSSVFMAQGFIQELLETKQKGNLLFISSEVGDLADNRPYGWTKASINSLVRGLASNFAKNDIRINAIAPGVTCSSMTGFDSHGNLHIPTNATKRAYLPEEIAEVATFLLSDCSECLSGQILVCNNGKTIYSREKIEKYG